MRHREFVIRGEDDLSPITLPSCSLGTLEDSDGVRGWSEAGEVVVVR
jgi:hypothetical protein